jgi:hypothetical protein
VFLKGSLFRHIDSACPCQNSTVSGSYQNAIRRYLAIKFVNYQIKPAQSNPIHRSYRAIAWIAITLELDPLPETCTLLHVYSPKVKDGFYASQHPSIPASGFAGLDTSRVAFLYQLHYVSLSAFKPFIVSAICSGVSFRPHANLKRDINITTEI